MNRAERIRVLAPYPLVVKDQASIEEAVIGAVADMKKMEKIQEAYDAWVRSNGGLEEVDLWHDVCEVFENGNDD